MVKAPRCTAPPRPAAPRTGAPHSLQALTASFIPEGRAPGRSATLPRSPRETQLTLPGALPSARAAHRPLLCPATSSRPACSHRGICLAQSHPACWLTAPGRVTSTLRTSGERESHPRPARLPAGSVRSFDTGVSELDLTGHFRPCFSPVPKGFHQECFQIPGEQ